MRKYIKKVLIVVILLLVTGCSGNYNLSINDDMSIDEELYLSIKNSEGLYQKTLNIFKQNNIDKKKYEVILSDNELQVTYNDSFNSIEEYLINSKIYHLLINQIEYNKSNKYIDLYVNEKLNIKDDILIDKSNMIDIDVLQINIKNPFDINYTNAEIENENVYTWTIKKGDVEKKIQMQFKPSLNIFPYKQVIVTSIIILCFVIIGITIYTRYKNKQKL